MKVSIMEAGVGYFANKQGGLAPCLCLLVALNSFNPFAAASSPATKGSLSTARCATAAAILQKVLHILPPIVVGNLLPRLDSA
jgi:hypothetical protein